MLTSILEIVGDLFETKNAGWISGAASGIAKEWWRVDPEDVFPILYNFIFLVINGYYILRWRVTRRPNPNPDPNPTPTPTPTPNQVGGAYLYYQNERGDKVTHPSPDPHPKAYPLPSPKP